MQTFYPLLHIQLTTLGVLLTCCLSRLHSTDEPDTKGTLFIIGFLDNNSTLNPELLIIPQSDCHVNITVSMPRNPGFRPIQKSLHQDDIAILELDSSVRMSGDGLGTQGVLVESSSDIVVYAVNKGHGSSDAFLALPCDALGEEYYVASYKPSKTYFSQVGIIGVENNTKVEILIPRHMSSTDLYVNGSWWASGMVFSINVSAYETLQLISEDDITGAWIKGSSPLVIISGDTATINTSQSFVWNDHFEEQLSPTKSWGRSFATVPFSGGLIGDVFRIIASQNQTNVKVKKRRDSYSVDLDAGGFTEVNVSRNDYISVVSSKPVLLLQYVLAEVRDNVQCDSFMLLVPPMEQRQHQYLFSTDHGEGAKNINLVITSDMVNGLLLDGQRLMYNDTHWVEIHGEDANYSAVQLSVSSGRHNLSHDLESGLFSAVSYGYPLGMRMVELKGEIYEVTYNADFNEPVTWSQDRYNPSNSHIERLNIIGAAVQESDWDGKGWSPAVLAVIISLSAAVFFVIACILGFLVAELVCKGDGPFRSIKILPIAN